MNGLFSNVVFIKDMEEYQSIQIIVKPVNLKKKILYSFSHDTFLKY